MLEYEQSLVVASDLFDSNSRLHVFLMSMSRLVVIVHGKVGLSSEFYLQCALKMQLFHLRELWHCVTSTIRYLGLYFGAKIWIQSLD